MSQDVYAKITGRIVSALRAGVVPWHQPWNAAQGRPRNLISGKPYRGINVWLLSHQAGSPFWLTYRQASQIGGLRQKRGKRPAPSFSGNSWPARVASRTAKQDGEQDSKEPHGYAMARAYTVFNASQCALPEAWAERAQVCGA